MSSTSGASDSMPSTAMPLAILSGQLHQLRARPGRGAAPDVLVQQQLAARRCPQPVDLLQRALVGDGEGADLLDVVTPELHPHRVLLGRREHVDDPAADRELAPLLDEVDACTPRPPGCGRRRRGRGVTADQLDRLEVPSPLTCGCRIDRTGATTICSGPLLARSRVAQPAQDGQPAPDGVAARASAARAERPPARVVTHQRGVDQVAEEATVLGLASGGGDGKDPTGPRQAGDHEGAQRLGTGEVERPHLPSRASARAWSRAGSARTASARPDRCNGAPRAGTDNTTAPGHG